MVVVQGYGFESSNNTVTLIDTSTRLVADSFHYPASGGYSGLNSIAMAPDGRFAYVTYGCARPCSDLGTVWGIGMTKNAGVGPIFVGWWPSGVAVTPDGSYLYVANLCGKDVSGRSITSRPARPRAPHHALAQLVGLRCGSRCC